MPAVKTYTRVNFQNYPSTSTPLNATNLNKLDKGIDDLDDEVVTVKNAIENMSFDADSISYDNTSSGLQATDVQGAVDEINDNLSKTTISNDTRIALTYNTEYTTLTDGYFRIAVNGIASSHIVTGYINGVTVMALCGSGTNSQFMSLLVRKGTKIKYNGDNSSSGDGYFYPLS